MKNMLMTLAKAMVGKDCTSKYSDNGLKRLRQLTNELEKHELERCNLENTYRQCVASRNEVVMLTFPDGKIAYLSKNCSELIGYEPEDLIDTIPWIVHGDDAARIRKCYNAALNGKQGMNVSYKVVTKQGKIKEIIHSWTPVYVGGELQLVASLLHAKSS